MSKSDRYSYQFIAADIQESYQFQMHKAFYQSKCDFYFNSNLALLITARRYKLGMIFINSTFV
jgi:hypothetical protein